MDLRLYPVQVRLQELERAAGEGPQIQEREHSLRWLRSRSLLVQAHGGSHIRRTKLARSCKSDPVASKRRLSSHADRAALHQHSKQGLWGGGSERVPWRSSRRKALRAGLLA